MSDKEQGTSSSLINIYTDGSCNPNPGPGGWGVVVLAPGRRPRELSGGEPDATNNRMELRAAIEALLALDDDDRPLRIFTDSNYLRKGITEWLPMWENRGWRTQGNSPVKNRDLWQSLAERIRRRRIDWRWVKGHADNRWNERADFLARSAMGRNLLPLGDNDAIHIFTGVSYSNKSKTGGWSAILRYRNMVKVLSGAAADTSGNRLHLQAALEGLMAVKKPLPINLYTLSGYLRDGASGWVRKWAARGWRTKEGGEVSHQDLWKHLGVFISRYQINWHVASKDNPPCEIQEAKILAGEAAGAR